MFGYLAKPQGHRRLDQPGEVFCAVQDLRSEWLFDGEQSAALLELVAKLPSVEVAGSVTDRLGRAGVAIQTRTRRCGAYQDTLVFNEVDGRLLEAETTYMGGIERSALAPRSVVSYISWFEDATRDVDASRFSRIQGRPLPG